jgi:hypothetical protein
MEKMIKKYLLVVVFQMIIVSVCSSQTKIDSTPGAATITADSLASGNYKDVLSSFYQIAINNLTGPNKELKFNSNPYAIMLRDNPNLQKSYYYYKYRNLRNLNINFDIELDSSYRLNGFSTGITYALVNNRDYTISKYFAEQEFKNGNDFNYHVLNNVINGAEQKLQHNSVGDTLFINKIAYSTDVVDSLIANLFRTKDFTFDKLDKNISNWILSINDPSIDILKLALKNDPKLSIDSAQHAGYDSLVNTYQNKLLWTVGATDTSYSNGNLFKNVQIYTEALQKLFNSNFEMDLKASVIFNDDSLQIGNNLLRQYFTFEPAINWVMVGNKSQKSYFEFKLGGSYTHFFSGRYVNENIDNTTLNGTLRVRVYNDIWVPLTIKYDPKTGNVFGFLNVAANFTGLSNLFKSSSQKQ